MRKYIMLVVLVCCLIVLPCASIAEDVVLVDNASVLCRLTGYDVDWLGNFSMKLYLENKTNKTAMFAIQDACVDGYVSDPFWAEELMPNSRKNVEIGWMGIEETPTLLEFVLRAYDSDDWYAEDFCNEAVMLYPQGVENVRLRTFEVEADDVVLFNTSDAMMVVTGFDEDGFMGYTMYAHLENKSDKTLMFSAEGAAVNGFSLDPFWAREVPAGRCADVEITWFSSDFDENGITEVEQIVLSIRVYDSDDWFADNLIDDSYSIVP